LGVSTPSALVRGDGRTARRDRNRLAVLDAVLELFAEDIDPGPEEVAQRCGLSPRSVYRYFEDRDELLRAAIERQLELIYPLQLIHQLGQGPLEERIDRFVRARVRLFDAVAATARATRYRVSRNATIAEQFAATRRALREQVQRQFASELDAMALDAQRHVLNTIDALTQFETLDYLSSALTMSNSALRAMLRDAIGALLNASIGEEL
jgi:AcrR family transcriptional regulator